MTEIAYHSGQTQTVHIFKCLNRTIRFLHTLTQIVRHWYIIVQVF